MKLSQALWQEKYVFSCIDLILLADQDKYLHSQESVAKARDKGSPCVPVLYTLVHPGGGYRCQMEGDTLLLKLVAPCDRKAMSAQRPISTLFHEVQRYPKGLLLVCMCVRVHIYVYI